MCIISSQKILYIYIHIYIYIYIIQPNPTFIYVGFVNILVKSGINKGIRFLRGEMEFFPVHSFIQ